MTLCRNCAECALVSRLSRRLLNNAYRMQWLWVASTMNTTTPRQRRVKSEALHQCAHRQHHFGTQKASNVPSAQQISHYSTLPLASASHACWITNGLPCIKHAFKTVPSTNNGTISSRGASEKIRHAHKCILLAMRWTLVFRLIVMLLNHIGTPQRVCASPALQGPPTTTYRTPVKAARDREM